MVAFDNDTLLKKKNINHNFPSFPIQSTLKLSKTLKHIYNKHRDPMTTDF